RVRTEAGTYRLGSEVAGHGQGLAPSHQLTKELRQFLPPELVAEGHTVEVQDVGQLPAFHGAEAEELAVEVVEGLRPVLKYAAPHVPHGLLALVVGLLGQSPRFLDLARGELRDIRKEEIEKTWRQLKEGVETKFVSKGVTSVAARRSANAIVLRPIRTNPGKVEIATLAGNI